MTKGKTWLFALAAQPLAAGALLYACTFNESDVPSTRTSPPPVTNSGNIDGSVGPQPGVTSASATLMDGDASVGTAQFSESAGSVVVDASVQGVPAGTYGLNIHAGTTCAAPGPLFGPDGGPYPGAFTIDVGTAGAGQLTTSTSAITVSQILNHVLVLDPLPDAGDASALGCGVVSVQ